MKILIVEDEALLAMELESEVEEAGHEIVGVAADSKQALSLIEKTSPQFAFVDIQLLDGPTGIDVGRHLASRSIPYVFVSGNLKRIPEDFAGALGAIEKLIGDDEIERRQGELASPRLHHGGGDIDRLHVIHRRTPAARRDCGHRGVQWLMLQHSNLCATGRSLILFNYFMPSHRETRLDGYRIIGLRTIWAARRKPAVAHIRRGSDAPRAGEDR